MAFAGDDEPLAVLEVAGAVSHSVTEKNTSTGPNLAVEFTPIENWLEIEIGVTPFLRRHHSAEWESDILFKKPWDLGKHAEFMAGFGPEWIHSARSNALGLEVAADFMYWPGEKRRFGWFVEPAWDVSFAAGHEKSIGFTAGLLIAIH